MSFDMLYSFFPHLSNFTLPILGVIVIIIIFLWMCFICDGQTSKFITNMKKSIAEINEVDGGDESSIELVQQINKIVNDNQFIKNAYKHFEHSQITNDQERKIYATHQVEEYVAFDKVFKLDRVTEDGGGILTGLGLLSTFIAIAYSLKELHLGNSELLQQGIGTLIDGLFSKFLSSIFGIATALVFTLFRNFRLNKVDKTIHEFNNLINKKIHNIYQENILYDIERGIKDQTDSLKEFFSGSAFHDALLDALNKNPAETKITGILAEIKAEISKQNGAELVNNIKGLITSLQGSVGELNNQQNDAMKDSLASFKQETERSLGTIQNSLTLTTQQLQTSFEASSKQRLKAVEEEQNQLVQNMSSTLDKFMQQLSNHNTNLQGGLQSQHNEISSANKLLQEQLKANQKDMLDSFTSSAKSGLAEIIDVLSKQQVLHNKIESVLNGYNLALENNHTLMQSSNVAIDNINNSANTMSTISANLANTSDLIKQLTPELTNVSTNISQQLEILREKERLVTEGLDQLNNSFRSQMQTWQTHIDKTDGSTKSANELLLRLTATIDSYTTEHQKQVTSFVTKLTDSLLPVINNMSDAASAIREYSEDYEKMIPTPKSNI